MRPAFLLLDDALADQERFVTRGLDEGARAIYARDLGPSMRLWGRPAAVDALRTRLREHPAAAENPDVFFCGSSDFHHVSCLLIARALEANPGPATIIHFDNHAATGADFENGLHCGAWAERAITLPGVRRLVTVGVCSREIDRPAPRRSDRARPEDDRFALFPYRAAQAARGRETLSFEDLGEEEFAARLLAKIETANVYITVDKDVLRAEEAITNWDQGRMSLAAVSGLIQRVALGRRVIGADIMGDWSQASFAGGWTKAMKWAEALRDQPWRRPNPSRAAAVNENANLALLDLFGGIAP